MKTYTVTVMRKDLYVVEVQADNDMDAADKAERVVSKSLNLQSNPHYKDFVDYELIDIEYPEAT